MNSSWSLSNNRDCRGGMNSMNSSWSSVDGMNSRRDLSYNRYSWSRLNNWCSMNSMDSILLNSRYIKWNSNRARSAIISYCSLETINSISSVGDFSNSAIRISHSVGSSYHISISALFSGLSISSYSISNLISKVVLRMIIKCFFGVYQTSRNQICWNSQSHRPNQTEDKQLKHLSFSSSSPM